MSGIYSSQGPEPETVKLACHTCGEEFEELVSVLVARFFTRRPPPNCINCDPKAEAQACWRVNVIQKRK